MSNQSERSQGSLDSLGLSTPSSGKSCTEKGKRKKDESSGPPPKRVQKELPPATYDLYLKRCKAIYQRRSLILGTPAKDGTASQIIDIIEKVWLPMDKLRVDRNSVVSTFRKHPEASLPNPKLPRYNAIEAKFGKLVTAKATLSRMVNTLPEYGWQTYVDEYEKMRCTLLKELCVSEADALAYGMGNMSESPFEETEEEQLERGRVDFIDDT
jgi:hypothetical protein